MWVFPNSQHYQPTQMRLKVRPHQRSQDWENRFRRRRFGRNRQKPLASERLASQSEPDLHLVRKSSLNRQFSTLGLDVVAGLVISEVFRSAVRFAELGRSAE